MYTLFGKKRLYYCKYIYKFIYIYIHAKKIPLTLHPWNALATLGSSKPPKQATSDSVAVPAHFGEQLYAPHGIDQVLWVAGTCGFLTREKVLVGIQACFLSRDDENHLLPVYTLCNCICDCVNFSAELGYLLLD